MTEIALPFDFYCGLPTVLIFFVSHSPTFFKADDKNWCLFPYMLKVLLHQKVSYKGRVRLALFCSWQPLYLASMFFMLMLSACLQWSWLNFHEYDSESALHNIKRKTQPKADFVFSFFTVWVFLFLTDMLKAILFQIFPPDFSSLLQKGKFNL